MKTIHDVDGIPDVAVAQRPVRPNPAANTRWRAAQEAVVFAHGDRVARISFAISRQLALPVPRAREIAAAACLHDIGKLLVPLEILEFRGALSASMRAKIQDHPSLGADLIAIAGRADTGDTSVLQRVALSHHEHFDGSGYPQGLAGEAIPLEARIVAVADTFDALVSARSYKSAWSQAQAIAEIERCGGSHFDPAVVAAFLEVVYLADARFWCNPVSTPWRPGCRALFDASLQWVLSLPARSAPNQRMATDLCGLAAGKPFAVTTRS